MSDQNAVHPSKEQPKAPAAPVKPMGPVDANTPSNIKGMQTAAEANTKARLAELTNVNRIVSNAINLINDVEIKGAHAQPVTEILGWLTGFSQSLTGQIKTLESTLPKPVEPKKPELKAVTPDGAKVALSGANPVTK